MKRLNELLDCDYDTLIKDIKIDSREIEDGDLFVAVNGFNCKHSDFIPQAIENGASAVICDIDYEADIPIIKSVRFHPFKPILSAKNLLKK